MLLQIIMTQFLLIGHPKDLANNLQDGCWFEDYEGFVKIRCKSGPDNSLSTKFRCINNNSNYYIPNSDYYSTVYSFQCPDDPFYYQACGRRSHGHLNGSPRAGIGQTFCNSIICYIYNPMMNLGINISSPAVDLNLKCNGVRDCNITGIDEAHCQQEEMVKCLYTENEKRIAKAGLCDGVCQCDTYCGDEVICNGYSHAYFCRGGHVLPGFQRCDGVEQCEGGEDEIGCGTDLMICETGFYGNIVLSNFSRCFTWVNCLNNLDQTNCSDVSKAPLQCDIQGFTSTVSENIICKESVKTSSNFKRFNESLVCDDGIDGKCVSPTADCRNLHKHKLCDDIYDCLDRSDEENKVCMRLTQESCVRKYSQSKKEMPIPLEWVLDGVVDCRDRKDENEEHWDSCEYKVFRSIVMQIKMNTCQDKFICNSNEKQLVAIASLCDRYVDCGTEESVCKSAAGTHSFTSKTIEFHHDKRIDHCLPGLKSMEVLSHPCKSDVQYPKNVIVGTKPNSFTLPDHKRDCSSYFGEQYVFLQCLDVCHNSSCPISQPLQHDSCMNNFKHRIYSIRDHDHLTLVTKSQGTFKVPNLFECKNGRCVTYDKVCDLQDDCGDGSDENECQNNFRCNVNSSLFGVSYIPKSSLCDGKFDCADLSDECSGECGRRLRIIKNILLKISAWIIGILATMFNIVLVSKNFFSIRKIRTSASLLNKTLIIAISFGDGLVGLYLILIGIADQRFGSEFCTLQREWLVSSTCTALGVASTLGAQISLFSMTILSACRFSGVTKGLAMPQPVTGRSSFIILAGVLLVFTVSLTIALIPVLPVYEDHFVNALYVKDNPLFKGFTTKQEFGRVIFAYYGRFKTENVDRSWENIRKFVIGRMFTQDHNKISSDTLSFYGNDAVCLFKYFVKRDDPQVKFSWGVLLLNFVCFIIITISYIIVNIVSMKSSHVLSKGKDPNKTFRNRNKKLQRKISFIIMTDFACWIPFIVVCALNTLEVIDASPSYALFSIVILPINSVINPLLYDDTLLVIVRRLQLKVMRLFRSDEENLNITTYTTNFRLKQISKLSFVQQRSTVMASVYFNYQTKERVEENPL